ncbi:DHS-like NAD/FAD-binding domain-containing protein [Pyronema domesticum]|uniref:Similar to NAD-dependent protein deacetylase SIR4 acc. no. F4P804 n=1 Tax=Pyronema omphalodes (strain CBS 100304) TaxID=1076935 RepID=U4LT91_PYROM|nr:DHS-like NAD/FAD-binding domain-containing protein [Pyronema domesticum]CCX30641.1 Similar to NAD-dependent protein deacetylase SIR4; acc. no. F4P804 [Pyronema omphalodes CBS 100304]
MVLPRIPYTTPFPPPIISPASAITLPGAVNALTNFLESHNRTLLLTGAGISVASGLSDYRGTQGTYRLNQSYRPIFFHEFTSSHASRQRYWARSYLGYGSVAAAKPNTAHHAIKKLWDLGLSSGVLTQNVDSLHGWGKDMPVVELHGTLRDVICLGCGDKMERGTMQEMMAKLNPAWRKLKAGEMGDIKMNPDGDVDVPGVEYGKFRYPVCPHCAKRHALKVDGDGAVTGQAEAKDLRGVLKPCVTFFGESVGEDNKSRAEELVEDAKGVLVVGSSLATYSAWRLVKEAKRQGKGIAVVNIGGIRGEEEFRDGKSQWVRVEHSAQDVLKGVVERLGETVVEREAEMNNSDVMQGMGLAG